MGTYNRNLKGCEWSEALGFSSVLRVVNHCFCCYGRRDVKILTCCHNRTLGGRLGLAHDVHNANKKVSATVT